MINRLEGDSEKVIRRSLSKETKELLLPLAGRNNQVRIRLFQPNGLLYACLVEAYGYLKGPMDMLTLYENKYKQEVQKFAAEQLGRRKRDDYTDGTVRIQVPSPTP